MEFDLKQILENKSKKSQKKTDKDFNGDSDSDYCFWDNDEFCNDTRNENVKTIINTQNFL